MSTPEYTIELAKADYMWRATIQALAEGAAESLVVWGKRNGKLQEKRSHYAEGKQGRNAVEQALLDVRQAARLKVRTRGYNPLSDSDSALLEEIDEEEPYSKRNKRAAEAIGDQSVYTSPQPMLASEWDAQEERYADDADVYFQPKLDGIRCIANLETGELWSRQRKRIDRLPWLEEQVRALGERLGSTDLAPTWLDGELYVHGKLFDEVSHLVRGSDPEHMVVYHVYDVILPLPFGQRSELLETLLAKRKKTQIPNITLVPTSAGFKSDAEAELQRAIASGYEGVMVRMDEVCKKLGAHPEELGYETAKRSRALCKFKEFAQEEYEIVDVLPQKGNAHVLGAFQLKLADSETTFKATTSGMSAATQAGLWQERESLPGQIATVKFQKDPKAGTDKVPRFAKIVGIRHPDDM